MPIPGLSTRSTPDVSAPSSPPVSRRPAADAYLAADRVLLAVRRGAESDAAVDWVRAEAAARTLRVVLLTVSDPGASGGGTDSAPLVRRAAARLGAIGPPGSVGTSIRRGDTVAELLRATADADLAVLGRSGGASRSAGFFSTLALSVAARSTVPVVVVPPGHDNADGPVVVGIDPDGSSDAAVDFGAREADARGVPLMLMHGWLADPEGPTSPPLEDPAAPDDQRLTTRETERVRERWPHLTVIEHVERSSALALLVRASRSAALVAVGTHWIGGRQVGSSGAHGALGSTLFGSVGHGLILHAASPVAIVPLRLP